jgi:site-specific DNA recombinase
LTRPARSLATAFAGATSILHNRLYVGRLVWNRQRFLKDPDTGKRVARTNPPSEWITKDVPDLRIIDDEVWQAVQTRYASVQRKWKKAEEGRRFNQFRRPKYLFSGLTKCGECGAGFIVYSREQLGCFGTRDRGTCTNKLTISRLEVEARVLSALQEKLMRKDFFEEFCREFAKETNSLRMEQRAGLSSAKRDLERVKRDIKKVIDAIKAGYAGQELKGEMDDLQARKEALVAQLATADEPPPLLHPSMADLYRSKVEGLASALQREDTRLEASEMLRGLIEAIVLTPEKGQLRIELRGNLAAMLTAAQKTKRSPQTGDLLVPVQLVAGARNRRYLQLWSGAA